MNEQFLDISSSVGLSIRFHWGISYDHEGKEIDHIHSGTIIQINYSQIVIRLDDTSQRVVAFSKQHLADQVSDSRFRNILYRHLAALRHQEKLNDPTPHVIYALEDPRDDMIFYIGMTQDQETRYRQHLQCKGNNPQKNARIQDILACGLQPRMPILEEAKGRYNALRRENYWIRYYLRRNIPLTNMDAWWLADWLAKETMGEVAS